jgi:hypothetical protein
MTQPLEPGERARLVGILSRVGSDFAGKQAAAAAAAHKFVTGRGLAWSDLLGATEQASPPPASEWRETVHQCQQSDGLTDWEKGFIHNLLKRRSPTTPKQLRRLDEIAARVAT